MFAAFQYHRVFTMVRNVEIELEAIVSSKMGMYHLRILQFPESRQKARELFRQSITLGISLQPRDVTSKEWYPTAEKKLDELQRLQNKEESIQNTMKRVEFQDELSAVNEFLQQNTGSKTMSEEILNVIRKFPPKNRYDEKNFSESKSEKVSFSFSLSLLLKSY